MLTTFTAAAGQAIRVIQIDGNPWFVAADVCRALGVTIGGAAGGTTRHLAKLASDEKRTLRRGEAIGLPLFGETQASSITVLSESGLYRLTLRSDKTAALAFRDWVTREVLPAIRKDGAYVMGEEKVRTGELTTGDRLPRNSPVATPRKPLEPAGRAPATVLPAEALASLWGLLGRPPGAAASRPPHRRSGRRRCPRRSRPPLSHQPSAACARPPASRPAQAGPLAGLR
ncbi:BRO-N domain-containing protein [Roseomonas sp. F4]